MNIFTRLKNDLIIAFNNLYKNSNIKLENISIEIPKDLMHGDLSTNVAMIIAARLHLPVREVALQFKDVLSTLPYIAHIEVAGLGFINFTLKAGSWQNCINDILENKYYFDQSDVAKNKKINIEYVSANPTGPLHIGHARCAIYGDVLANILAKCGYEITREYYVNDAGAQIKSLTDTVFLRYKEALTQEKIEIPGGLYPGEYLIVPGKDLAQKYGDKLLTMPEQERSKIVKNFIIPEMINVIKEDLSALGINHDIFKSEQELHNKDEIINTIELLKQKGRIYIGKLPPPKGKIDENWEDREQLLFKSTDFGDDIDRPLQKANGEWTYFAADIAYANDKIQRGYSTLIYVLGADHSGYIKRIQASVSALSDKAVECRVKICQLVKFVKAGEPFKMSKRAGNFIGVSDITAVVHKDIIRFMLIYTKNDTPINFDLEKVTEQTKENPIFYIQYAHVRTISIIENAKDKFKAAYDNFINKEYDLTLLELEKEMQLIKLLTSFTKILETSAHYFEPHRLALYLEEVAAMFHSLWNMGKENEEYRFIIENNLALTSTRLALVLAVQHILREGLKIIGVDALTKM